MLVKNTEARYGVVSKVLHWSMALGMVGLIWLGWYMVELSYFDKWYYESLEFHKAFGIVVFVIGAAMVIWKMVSPSPDFHVPLPRWQQIVARALQGIMLLLVITIPLSGYLISTAAGKSISMFGWFDIPAFIAVDGNLREIATDTHYYSAYAVAGMIVLHASAALKHQLIDRDGTLARMIWR